METMHPTLREIMKHALWNYALVFRTVEVRAVAFGARYASLTHLKFEKVRMIFLFLPPV